jgi:hypothetical protein
MKRIFQTAAILSTCILTIAACTKNGDDTPSQPSSANVSGKVTDVSGKAISNAKITIEHTVWYDNYVYAVSNSNGEYSASLPDKPEGTWTAKAQIERSAYSETYKFDLDPSSTDPFDKTKTATRNFTWKLSGKRAAGDTYYGAHVDLYVFGTDAQMDKMKLVLTPIENTLIDGSTATSIETTVEDVAGTFMAKDIPIGKYNVKAVYPGKTILLQNRHIDNDEPAVIKEVVFGKNGNLGETEYNIEFWVSE